MFVGVQNSLGNANMKGFGTLRSLGFRIFLQSLIKIDIAKVYTEVKFLLVFLVGVLFEARFPLKQNQLSVQPRFLIHSNWICQAYRCNLIAEQNPPLGSEDDTKFVGFSWRMMSKKLGG